MAGNLSDTQSSLRLQNQQRPAINHQSMKKISNYMFSSFLNLETNRIADDNGTLPKYRVPREPNRTLLYCSQHRFEDRDKIAHGTVGTVPPNK
jgi:hypothetical protein